MNSEKLYFPNLNGLRFIAAMLVIIHHTEQLKSTYGMDNYWWVVPFVGVIGKLGVVLFFCLSGFLITYLLLAEEKKFNTISVPKFYIRRILRIWPLYYFILFLGFFVLPNVDFFVLPNFDKETIYNNLNLKLFFCLIFFPNLAFPLFGKVPYASQTWSIGTEEQYYLVWPLILKIFKTNRVYIMLTIILMYLLSVVFFTSSYSDGFPLKNALRTFLFGFNIDCMAIGGIFAIVLFQKHKILKFLLNLYVFYFSLLLSSFLIIKGVLFPYFHYELYSILFGIIILNFAANPRIIISFENKILNYLGTISYGLYMYHQIGIVTALMLLRKFDLLTNWLIYPISLLFTVVLAGISYRYFETYFLKFKDKFTLIKSGNEIKK